MVTIPVLGDVIREVGETLRQVIPDPKAKAELQVRLAELADKADARETDLMAGQIRVNEQEAKHANLFVAGWRPAVGWCCALALAYTWIVAPLAKAAFRLDDMPALDPNAIYPVLTAMLGIGAMRTVEKLSGVATSVGGTVLAPCRPPTWPPRSASPPSASPRSPAWRSAPGRSRSGPAQACHPAGTPPWPAAPRSRCRRAPEHSTIPPPAATPPRTGWRAWPPVR